MGISALFINLLKFNGKLWGSFLSGEVYCICAGGGGGRAWGSVHSEEPLESKYDANSDLGEVQSEWCLGEVGSYG